MVALDICVKRGRYTLTIRANHVSHILYTYYIRISTQRNVTTVQRLFMRCYDVGWYLMLCCIMLRKVV